MAAITNYDTLKTAVTRYLVFDDVVAEFDAFLALAGQRLNRDLRVSEMVEETSESLAGKYVGMDKGDFGSSLPTENIVEIIAIYTAEGGSLQQINVERLLRLVGYWDGSAEAPELYAIGGGSSGARTMFFAPNATTKTVFFKYFMEIPELSASNTTNEIVAKYGGIYLYAVLLEAAAYMNDPEKEMSFLKMYERTRDVLNSGAARNELNPSLDKSEKRNVNLPPGSELPGQKEARAADMSGGI